MIYNVWTIERLMVPVTHRTEFSMCVLYISLPVLITTVMQRQVQMKVKQRKTEYVSCCNYGDDCLGIMWLSDIRQIHSK